MNFKSSKIRTENNKKVFGKTKGISISISLLISLSIIIFLSIGIVKAVKNINFSGVLSLAGADLKTDGYGHSNFLILGIGGGAHEGADLTDSIIVASLDPETKNLSMLSIPRDIYVKDSTIGNSRINEVYLRAKNYFGSSTKGVKYMKEKTEEIVGIPIHYWVKIDFKGFKEMIDALGGIDIYVKEDLNDPYYPKDGTFEYAPLLIQKGNHKMDGELALKYARSRKTTSDFDRARRQQEIIYATKQKALSTNTLADKEKIENILDILKSNIETNITIKEVLTLGSMASEITEDKILHRLIHDDPALCGGLLYAPERESYDGMFVFIAAGGVEFLHKYADLTFNHPLVAKENPTIELLNGTSRGGAAGETKQILRRFCFDVVKFGNARNKNIEETTYYYRQKTDTEGKPIESRPKALDFLQKLIPGNESTVFPIEYSTSPADLIIEIGADYSNSKDYLEDAFYSLPKIETTTTTEETPDSTEETQSESKPQSEEN
ncbi:MAG: LCP family protein [Candidatus Gracilibacteria bacterium]|nr:LCP family protein [Candidatus Gracilibacteria bacterium]